MTPATLQALRRLLFFSRQEAAALVASSDERPRGVSDRAWRQWEAGEIPVPEDVVVALRSLCAWRSMALATARKKIETLREAQGAPESIVLIWYGSVEDWMTLPGREAVMWRPQCSVVADLAGSLPDVDLVKFDRAAYAAWLGRRRDNEAMRSQWGALYADL